MNIQWNPASDQVTVIVDGGPASAVWTLPASWASTFFGGATSVYYGWGASTGGATNYEQVEQTSANLNACSAAPTPGTAPTPLALAHNVCGNTPAPTFTPPGPTDTPTKTPTPYPTVCGATPAWVESTILGNTGCAGSGNPISWTYTVPANPGQIMLVQVESTGTVITSATWNGTALTALPGSPQAISGGGDIYTYYMVNPPPGTFVINFPGASGCSWNPTVSVYKNINTASPFGTITSTSNTGSNDVVDTITTTSRLQHHPRLLRLSQRPLDLQRHHRDAAVGRQHQQLLRRRLRLLLQRRRAGALHLELPQHRRSQHLDLRDD